MYIHVYRVHVLYMHMYSEDVAHAFPWPRPYKLHSCHFHGVAGSLYMIVHSWCSQATLPGWFPNAQSPNSKLTMSFAEKQLKFEKI